jgi:dihydrofolate reductase
MSENQRRLYVSMITSLDGYIEGPNRELDWFLEGKQFDLYADEMTDSVGVAVYGRTSYELMVQYWPAAETQPRNAWEGPFAKKINALPKVVLSTTLQHAAWANTRIVRDVEAIAAMKREAGKPIVAWAGARLVDSLLKARLVDEIRVAVQPVVLGKGTPLFLAPAKLRQVSTRNLGGDLSVLCYEPVYA